MSIYIGWTELRGWSWRWLPPAYQEVEYIQSSWTQRINTWLYVNSDYTVEANFIKTQNVSYWTLFWERDGNYKRFVFRAQSDISGYKCQRSYNTTTTYGEEYTFTTWYSDENNHTIKMNRYVYFDGSLLKTFSATAASWTATYTLSIFAIHWENNRIWDFWYYKLFYLKIWDSNNNLVRDFVPCYRKSDSVIWLYDLVNNTFYTNAWTWTFSKWNNVNSWWIFIWGVSINSVYVGNTKVFPTSRLPSTFQEVSYIQTTWTQYINTRLFAYNYYQTETKVQISETDTSYTWYPLFWCYYSYSWRATSRNYYYHCTFYNNSCYFWNGTTENHLWSYNFNQWEIYEVKYNTTTHRLIVNNKDIWDVSWTVWYNNSVLCMALRWNPTYKMFYWRYKYYYFKIYDNNQWKYILDLVPCYRKSDSVIWMYDLVNNQFYTNSGSWTFTKWPDV